MRRMNDKYALNLENLVAQRSAELEIAREQTERLLHEILPPYILFFLIIFNLIYSILRSIAKSLKANEEIQPRSYESATVLFCQLVDFETILNKLLPNQVIEFLNSVIFIIFFNYYILI